MRAFCLLITTLLCAWPALADDAALRREMERTYSTWRSAMVAKDVNGWQQATAAHKQVSTRNLIVSQRQPFPKALFDLPMHPPEIGTLRFVRMDIKGPTAHLAYFGKVNLGLAAATDIPDSLLILKFAKEAQGWKFDTNRLVNLNSAPPEIRAALAGGGNAGFLTDPAFAPDGEVPPVAAPCPVPDHIGVLQIASFGYKTVAAVNGFTAATVQNNSEEHIIIGGLRDGANPLTLQTTKLPIPEGEKRALEVQALVLTGSSTRPTIRVYTWSQEGEAADGEAKQVIHVNKITLR